VNYVITEMKSAPYLAEFLMAKLTNRNRNLQSISHDQESVNHKGSSLWSRICLPSVSTLVNHWKSIQHKQRIHMDSLVVMTFLPFQRS